MIYFIVSCIAIVLTLVLSTVLFAPVFDFISYLLIVAILVCLFIYDIYYFTHSPLGKLTIIAVILIKWLLVMFLFFNINSYQPILSKEKQYISHIDNIYFYRQPQFPDAGEFLQVYQKGSLLPILTSKLKKKTFILEGDNFEFDLQNDGNIQIVKNGDEVFILDTQQWNITSSQK